MVRQEIFFEIDRRHDLRIVRRLGPERVGIVPLSVRRPVDRDNVPVLERDPLNVRLVNVRPVAGIVLFSYRKPGVPVNVHQGPVPPVNGRLERGPRGIDLANVRLALGLPATDRPAHGLPATVLPAIDHRGPVTCPIIEIPIGVLAGVGITVVTGGYGPLR